MTKVSLFTISLLIISAQSTAEVNAARQSELMHLLKQDCGSCHGLTLKGGLGPALLPETLNGKPKELLVTTILEGRPGTAMPPWKAMLSQDDAEWIADKIIKGIN